MSLLSKYTDTKTEQGVITTIDRITGRVGVYLRNGLSSTATYLYNLQDLRVGMPVIVTKVSGAYVILNRLVNYNLKKSYSTPKTSTISSNCASTTIGSNSGDEVIVMEADSTLWLYAENSKTHTRYKWVIKEGPGYFSDVGNTQVLFHSLSYTAETVVSLKLTDGTICDEITILTIGTVCESTIGYSWQRLPVNMEETLYVIDPISGASYHWMVVDKYGEPAGEDYGWMLDDEGLYVIYHAPATNPNCDKNPTIQLYIMKEDGNKIICDELAIAIGNPNLDGLLAVIWCENLNQSGCPEGLYGEHCERWIRCDGLDWRSGDDGYCRCTTFGEAPNNGYFAWGPCSGLGYVHMGYKDLRNESMKESGCCPPQLL